jgi:hypothetical protein
LVSEEFPCRFPGLVLATLSAEYHVFRATLVSIVLSLAVGQPASLLCKVACDGARECHHEYSGSTSPDVASDTSCDHVAPGVSPFLKEDSRRTSAPSGDAIEVPRSGLDASTIDTLAGREPGQLWSLEKRPLVTALRI